MAEAHRGIGHYLRFYNEERLHQSLQYRTPWTVYSQPAPLNLAAELDEIQNHETLHKRRFCTLDPGLKKTGST
jgi:hypothetical protein